MCVQLLKYNYLPMRPTILNHTHPLLGRYASSRVPDPLFENSGSAPDIHNTSPHTALPNYSLVIKDACT